MTIDSIYMLLYIVTVLGAFIAGYRDGRSL